MNPTLYRPEPVAGSPGERGGYHVRLDPGAGTEPGFDGPLELLLRLVRDHRADPLQIEISRITREYLATLEVMEMLDLEVGSEFLKTATALLRIKARRLLPSPPRAGRGPGSDSGADLEARLADYARYRAAAAKLRRSLDGRASVWGPPPEFRLAAKGDGAEFFPESAGPPRLAEGAPVDLFAVVEAFRRVVARSRARPAPPLPRPRVSVAQLLRRFEKAVPPGTAGDFEEILFASIGAELAGGMERPTLIAAFLALLELARRGRISILQERDFGPIRIVGLRPDGSGG